MKTILSSRKHHYVAKVCIFLITVALIAGIVSCVEERPGYDLTISGTEGGSVTTPGEGVLFCEEGQVVSLFAEPDEDYEFVNWAAPAGTFADANAAETTFTMPAQNVTATANFRQQAAPLDHFKCYPGSNKEYIGKVVHLEDQFVDITATVFQSEGFCNPVVKYDLVTYPILNPDHHLTLYSIIYTAPPQKWSVVVDNQFGIQNLTVSGPAVMLAVPTQKESHEKPVGLDHFLLYNVIEGPPPKVVVNLNDQFVGMENDLVVNKPVYFANPVQKTTDDGDTYLIGNPDEHLVFYEILGGVVLHGQVKVVNQFGNQTLNMYDPSLLAVPSEKTGQIQRFSLTTSSTCGGSVTTPGEGTFYHNKGTVVNLVATPRAGYSFVNWTGDVGTVANITAATTTITMNDNYYITANFEHIPPG